MNVCGIVLGAGSSRRLGRPKQTLPLGDTTLLGRVVGDVEASSLDRVIVVVNETVPDLVPGRADLVSNASYATGCASSLLAGLDSAGDCDAVMLLLGDMPGVDAAVIDAVRADWEHHRPWAAVTDYQGAPGHPFVFSADAFPVLRGLHGDKAVWKVLDAQPERVRRIPVGRPLPRDVDTWEDYEAVCAAFGVSAPVR